jgi:hypothetical protein
MARIPSAAALGWQGMPAERLHSTQYVVLTPRTMVVIEANSDMLSETIRILTIAGEVEITVFKREPAA